MFEMMTSDWSMIIADVLM